MPESFNILVEPGIYLDREDIQYIVLDPAIDLETGVRMVVMKRLYFDGRGIMLVQEEAKFATRIACGDMRMVREFP